MGDGGWAGGVEPAIYWCAWQALDPSVHGAQSPPRACFSPSISPLFVQGFQAQGNEFSYFMLLASAYLLNGVERPEQVCRPDMGWRLTAEPGPGSSAYQRWQSCMTRGETRCCACLLAVLCFCLLAVL